MRIPKLLHSRKVQIALAALLAKTLLYFVPDFPPDVYGVIEELAIALIAAIAAEDAAQKFGQPTVVDLELKAEIVETEE
jgi:hypothetical protein